MNDGQPVLCVFRADNLTAWIVAVCHGQGCGREILARLATREQAIEFAAAEQQRRRMTNQPIAEMFLPEECACVTLPSAKPHAA